MKKNILKTLAVLGLILSSILFYNTAQAQAEISDFKSSNSNIIDELDPTAENIEEILNQLDQQYFEETGKKPFIYPSFIESNTCRRFDCPVYALVDKSEQRMYLYINGSLEHTWLVSTGKALFHETPVWEGHPNGRIYDAYTSKANPGGDYKGLGNMPYAVFLKGGYAIHGTLESNYSKLGRKASHGCVRLHSDNAKIFNRLVRQYGISSTWVQIIK